MQVYYKRLIEGVSTPATIQNGGYHFILMPVGESLSINDLGDMDSKDWDYRRILLELDNKREV